MVSREFPLTTRAFFLGSPYLRRWSRSHRRTRSPGVGVRVRRPGDRYGRRELHITSVSRVLLAGFKARASFMFAGCRWRRSLAADGGSVASRGHVPVMRSPRLARRVRACTVHLRCGSCAPPLSPIGLTAAVLFARRGGVKGGFACAFTRHLALCLLPCGHSRS